LANPLVHHKDHLAQIKEVALFCDPLTGAAGLNGMTWQLWSSEPVAFHTFGRKRRRRLDRLFGINTVTD
jgi:hypothetical protein